MEPLGFAADKMIFRNFGFSDPCAIFASSKIERKYESLIRKLRDEASETVKKIKKHSKKKETFNAFSKDLDKLLKDATTEMSKHVNIKPKDLIRFAQNAAEIENDISEEAECTIGDVRKLISVKMAAVRNISNQAAFS